MEEVRAEDREGKLTPEVKNLAFAFAATMLGMDYLVCSYIAHGYSFHLTAEATTDVQAPNAMPGSTWKEFRTIQQPS